MKTPKLLKIVKKYIDADTQTQLKNEEHILVIIHKLKKKQVAAKAKREAAESETERTELSKEIEIIKAQRKKGLKALKKARKKRKGIK